MYFSESCNCLGPDRIGAVEVPGDPVWPWISPKLEEVTLLTGLPRYALLKRLSASVRKLIFCSCQMVKSFMTDAPYVWKLGARSDEGRAVPNVPSAGWP